MTEDELYQAGYEAGQQAMFNEMKSQASEDDGKISELESILAIVKGKCDRLDAAEIREICERALAGSAETGGEKAAPENDELHKAAWELSTWAASINWDHRAKNTAEWLDGLRERIEAVQIFGKPETNFPRTSQNQTVSTGVEGAHEGITADKSEPEKLNNVQKSGMLGHALVELSMMQSDRDDLRTALDDIVERAEKYHYAPTLSTATADGMLCNVVDMAKKALEFSRRPGQPVALAESSLSSPPPRRNE